MMKYFVANLFIVLCIASSYGQSLVPVTIFHYNDFHAQYLPLKLSYIDSIGKRVHSTAGGAAEFKPQSKKNSFKN